MYRKNVISRAAFSLIEVIITIAVIGVMAGVLIPSITGYINMSEMQVLNNNARTVFLATQSYLTNVVGDGNSADLPGSISLSAADIAGIEPSLPANELAENSDNLAYLVIDRQNVDKQTTTLYQILSEYVEDITLLNDHSILVEYNRLTGQVRSAFVSDQSFLSYSGELAADTNVLNRTQETLNTKKLGYYGVQYTGVLPTLPDEQELELRIVNEDGLLYVEASIAELNSLIADGTSLTVSIMAFSDLSTSLIDFEITEEITITSAQTALAQSATYADEDAIYYVRDAVNKDKLYIIIDAISEYNAFNSTTDISMNEKYPEIPIDFITASMTSTKGGVVTGEAYAPEMVHSYFGNQTADDTGKLTFDISDSRHLNNIRYVADDAYTAPTDITDVAFEQKEDIALKTYNDQNVIISPLGTLQENMSYSALRADATEEAPNYVLDNLRVSVSTNVPSGMFAQNNGEIKDLTLTNTQITARAQGGMISGISEGSVNNIIATGTVTGGNIVGGITGVNSGEVIGCSVGEIPIPAAGVVDPNAQDLHYASDNESLIQTGNSNGSIAGGIVGENISADGEALVSECINIARVYSSSSAGVQYAIVGGLIGSNSNNGMLTLSYNAGEIVNRNTFGSVGGVVGRNGITGASGNVATIQYTYNTGRVNLADTETSTPKGGIEPFGANIGGIVGYNTSFGRMYDSYNSNYLTNVTSTAPLAALGGIVGRDETTLPEHIENCSFIMGESQLVNLTASAVVDHPSMRAVFAGVDGYANLTPYYNTPNIWTTDNPALRDTYYYRYPHFDENVTGEKYSSYQRTPWDDIVAKQPTINAVIVNSELLTLEWEVEDKNTATGVDILLTDTNGTVIDRLSKVNLTGVQADLVNARSSGNLFTGEVTGGSYPIYYDEVNGKFVMVLDGLDIENQQNTFSNNLTNYETVQAEVTMSILEIGITNVESTLFNTPGTALFADYAVANARHLYNVRYREDADFVQIADVTMRDYDNTSNVITPIADLTNEFTGTYDGNGYSISTLHIESSKVAGTTPTGVSGMFGTIAQSGIVRNVTINSGSILGTTDIGAIAAVNAGRIENCMVLADVSVIAENGSQTNAKNIGGIVGRTETDAFGSDVAPIIPAGATYLSAEYYNYIPANVGNLYNMDQLPADIAIGDSIFIAFNSLYPSGYDSTYKSGIITLRTLKMVY